MDAFRAWSFALCLLLLPAPFALAGDIETREFVIHIDGKESGTSTMTIVQQDDGVSYMKGKLSVSFRKILFNYQLTVDSEEWWKQGKLIGLKTNAAENAKKTEVTVRPAEKGLQVTVNGQSHLLTPELWTSSYWKLPDPKFHNQQIPIVEADTGKEQIGKLEYVKTEQLPVNKQPTKVYHFRVTGIANPVDLWFDEFHRLVRQEFTEDGFKTIVHLAQVRRNGN